jgi:hypothetical protein
MVYMTELIHQSILGLWDKSYTIADEKIAAKHIFLPCHYRL